MTYLILLLLSVSSTSLEKEDLDQPVDSSTREQVLSLVDFKITDENFEPTAQRVFTVKRTGLINRNPRSPVDLESFYTVLFLRDQTLPSGFCLRRLIAEFPESCTKYTYQQFAFTVWSHDSPNVGRRIFELFEKKGA